MANQIYNPTRICEIVICASCFGLSTSTIVMENAVLHDPLRSTVVVLPAVYGVLTLLNVLVSTTNEPLLWKIWIPLALLAAMLFYVSTGCLVWTNTIGTGYYELFLIVYGFAGSVFLFDVVEMAMLQCFPEEAGPSQQHAAIAEKNDKSVQVEIETEPKCAEHVDDSRTKKFNKRSTSSHGGTFHVSKNIVPLSTMRSEDDSDKSCDCRPHPTRVGIKTIAGPRRTSPASTRQPPRQPLATYQLTCTDCECPCNTDEYVYGVQRKKLAAIERSTSGKCSVESCPTSNSTSNQNSPVSDNDRECRSSSFATNYSTSVERAIIFQKFTQNSESVWNPWAPGADRSYVVLPGAVAHCTQPTAMNIERCITIKQAGSYIVSPQIQTPKLNRTLPGRRISHRGTRCTQM